MKKFLLIALAAFGFLTGSLHASDDPKTLPPAAYEQMKNGNKLDKIWLDPAFDKSQGYKTNYPTGRHDG